MTLSTLRGGNLPVRRIDKAGDTALTPFTPWRELEEMSRWFDTFMNRSFDVRPYSNGPAGGNMFAVDLYESSEELCLFAYVPGSRADGFDISVSGNLLTIRGERQPLITGEQWRCYGSGVAQSQGTFEASYTLPVEVAADKVSATYHEGVLELHLPKAEQAKVRTVKVNVQNQ